MEDDVSGARVWRAWPHCINAASPERCCAISTAVGNGAVDGSVDNRSRRAFKSGESDQAEPTRGIIRDTSYQMGPPWELTKKKMAIARNLSHADRRTMDWLIVVNESRLRKSGTSHE
ncbi:hypothetical protein AcW1_003991 [Taiwanofungus camphoratus]|nr:hypothetical protein AcW1_003991 [Antrodia cinnamomea]